MRRKSRLLRVLLGVISGSALAGGAGANPYAFVIFSGGGDDEFAVFVDPDPELIEPGGSVVSVELATDLSPVLTVTGTMLNSADWPTPIAAPNPFTGTVTSGLVVDDHAIFASFESVPITSGDYVELFRFSADLFPGAMGFTIGLTGTVTLGGVQLPVDTGLSVDGIGLGDLNLDGDVDTDDFGIFVNSFQLSPQGGPPFAPGDYDEDGDVDVDDFGIFVFSYQDFNSFAVAVPEPAPLLLALAGAATAATRRNPNLQE